VHKSRLRQSTASTIVRGRHLVVAGLRCAWRQFRHITLPLLRPSIAVALTIGTVWAIKIFDEIYVLNGTALNTRSILIQVYNTTFAQADFAHGTALAFLLAAVTAVFGGLYALALRRSTV